MASDMFAKWLKHYDPIHRGHTPAGLANGVTATNGWSFPRVQGGYNLYRGANGWESIDFADPVGAGQRTATSIFNFSWRGHAAATRYVYAVKAVSGGGVESAGSTPALVAEFDGGGNLVGLRPNGPTEVLVLPAVGGRFLVRWVYASRLQEAEPAQFNVYHDAGTGTVDYQTVIAQVAYRKGRAHYQYTSGAFGHGARRVWSVRAVTGQGVDDGNVLSAFGWADADAPQAHPLVQLLCLAEEEGVGS
ncbi:MAG: hypothetical protein V3W34_00880 [Phycisphaerae bacterium]